MYLECHNRLNSKLTRPLTSRAQQLGRGQRWAPKQRQYTFSEGRQLEEVKPRRGWATLLPFLQLNPPVREDLSTSGVTSYLKVGAGMKGVRQRPPWWAPHGNTRQEEQRSPLSPLLLCVFLTHGFPWRNRGTVIRTVLPMFRRLGLPIPTTVSFGYSSWDQCLVILMPPEDWNGLEQ